MNKKINMFIIFISLLFIVSCGPEEIQTEDQELKLYYLPLLPKIIDYENNEILYTGDHFGTRINARGIMDNPLCIHHYQEDSMSQRMGAVLAYAMLSIPPIQRIYDSFEKSVDEMIEWKEENAPWIDCATEPEMYDYHHLKNNPLFDYYLGGANEADIQTALSSDSKYSSNIPVNRSQYIIYPPSLDTFWSQTFKSINEYILTFGNLPDLEEYYNVEVNNLYLLNFKAMAPTLGKNIDGSIEETDINGITIPKTEDIKKELLSRSFFGLGVFDTGYNYHDFLIKGSAYFLAFDVFQPVRINIGIPGIDREIERNLYRIDLTTARPLITPEETPKRMKEKRDLLRDHYVVDAMDGVIGIKRAAPAHPEAGSASDENTNEPSLLRRQQFH